MCVKKKEEEKKSRKNGQPSDQALSLKFCHVVADPSNFLYLIFRSDSNFFDFSSSIIHTWKTEIAMAIITAPQRLFATISSA